MSSTTFTNGTIITSSWLNDVNTSVYTTVPTKATKGANSDITSLSGLTTALSVGQGGTGATTASAARTSLGAAASGANTDITSLNSPALGAATATTQAQNDNTTKVATTAYVDRNATTTLQGTVKLAATTDVQTGTDATKVLTPSSFRGGSIVRATPVATTSGTAIDFTGIPSWANRIYVLLDNVSTNGTSPVQVQIGSGSIDTASYVSTSIYLSAATSSTNGLLIGGLSAADQRVGLGVLIHMGSNKWVWSCDALVNTSNIFVSTGIKTLAGALDRIRLTTVTGADTFDLGNITITWE